MIRLDSFLDATVDRAGHIDPRTRTLLYKSFNGPDPVVVIPKFYLHN
jgi:hypothetical protein